MGGGCSLESFRYQSINHLQSCTKLFNFESVYKLLAPLFGVSTVSNKYKLHYNWEIKRDCESYLQSCLTAVISDSLYYKNVAVVRHDFLEGVGPKEVRLVLASLVTEKIITLDELNKQMMSFDYG